MTIQSGTRLGPYEVIAPIGAGGMGEVYKAKDTRLDRTVAIKVLPEHLAESPERKARFEREAKAISQLNHPHICTLHDVGEQDGIDFIVMEYIEGETLAERLRKGALKLDEALEYGIQIADGLDTAHRAGIVHRDLKPANAMLTKSGIKLLDFGLARLVEGDDDAETSDAPTRQKDLTAEESIVGTLQYMAPEQLERKQVDARTDIFAFGVVLYEMLSGNRAFQGESQASLISAIMKDEPSPMSLTPMTPSSLERTVLRCLAKAPEDRWQSTRDLCEELRWIREKGFDGARLETATSSGHGVLKRGWPLALVALVTGIVAVVVTWNALRPDPAGSRPVTRFDVSLAPGTDRIAFSPDGRSLVYSGRRNDISERYEQIDQLYWRSLDQFNAAPIFGTEGAGSPFFSPDGKWVGYFAGSVLKKVPLSGGASVTLCDAGSNIVSRRGGTWGPNDNIVFSYYEQQGLVQVSATGGDPHSITVLDEDRGEVGHFWPSFLPGGKELLFTLWFGSSANARIVALSLDTGEQKELLDGTSPSYLGTGHIVFARDRALWMVPFDADQLELTGAPSPIVEDIPVGRSGQAGFAVAGDGSLAYLTVTAPEDRTLAWVDRQGAVEPLPTPPRAYYYPRLAPDDKRVAVTVVKGGYEPIRGDIWVFEPDRGTATRLTFTGDNRFPSWTPDGSRIAFDSTRNGESNIYWKSADGVGEAEQLTTGGFRQGLPDVGRESAFLAFFDEHPSTSWDIWVQSLDGDREGRPFINTKFIETGATFSPDGEWLAYTSNESGQFETYVVPFPGPGRRRQISTDGGVAPIWSRDGSLLFYNTGERLMSAGVESREGFTAPQVVFEGYKVPLGATWVGNFDVSSNGRRILIVQGDDDAPTQANVILNWADEL